MQNFVFINHARKYVKVMFSDIMYIEALRNYIKLVTLDNKTYLALVTMKEMERMLPENLFCRVHRSYIVSMHIVTAFDNEAVYIINDKILPLGGCYREHLQESVMIVGSEVKKKRPLKKAA